MWGQFSWKKSLLVPWKILGVFVDTLTADENYSLLNRDNLKHHIQMQLSQKQNTFSNFFFHFQNLNGILNISKKRDNPFSRCIFELTDSENVVR